MHKKLLIAGLAVFAGLVLCAVLFAPKLYSLYETRRQEAHKVQIDTLVTEATDLYDKGDLDGARTLYEQGVQLAMNTTERAQFELLIAATYEKTDLMRCAQLYNSILVNPTYPDDIRARAGTYLLMALANTYNPTVASKVFTDAPWTGYLTKESPSPGMNYQMALVRGHEWVIATYPNFLSLLSAGSFYASLYAYAPEEKRTPVASRVASYFEAGSKELAIELSKSNWHPNVLAIGNLLQAVYAEDLRALSKNKSTAAVVSSSPSEEAIEAMYMQAQEYATKQLEGEVRSLMVFNVTLAHAHFLLSLSQREPQRLTQFGDALAVLIETDAASAGTAEVFGRTPTFAHARYRATLIAVASTYSPKLKAALLTKTRSFTQEQFIPK